MLLLVNFLWSVINIIGCEHLFEILVFERRFAFPVLLGSYYSCKGIKFNVESFLKISSVYCDEYFFFLIASVNNYLSSKGMCCFPRGGP